MIIFLTILTILLSTITTIPFYIGLLAIVAVIYKKAWVFFLALGLGLFLDLISIRSLGHTGLVLTIFVFLLFLYERKFETQTVTFVFISTFLGSIFYLWLFGYSNIILQSLVCAVVSILLFKFLISNFKFKMNSEILNG